MSQDDGDRILHQDEVEAVIDARFAILMEDQGSSEPTVYTIGPAAGDYDIEWSSASMEFPSWASEISGLRPQLTVIGKIAVLTGNIKVTGALQQIDIALPDELCPAVESTLAMIINDSSVSHYVPGSLTVYTGPGGSIQASRTDGEMMAADDNVILSGTYILV